MVGVLEFIESPQSAPSTRETSVQIGGRVSWLLGRQQAGQHPTANLLSDSLKASTNGTAHALGLRTNNCAFHAQICLHRAFFTRIATRFNIRILYIYMYIYSIADVIALSLILLEKEIWTFYYYQFMNKFLRYVNSNTFSHLGWYRKMSMHKILLVTVKSHLCTLPLTFPSLFFFSRTPTFYYSWQLISRDVYIRCNNIHFYA